MQASRANVALTGRPGAPRSTAVRGEVVATRPNLEFALIAVFIAGYYLHHNLYLTDSLFVPAYLATFAGFAILILNARRLPSDLFIFGVAVTAVALVSILCNPPFWSGWAGAFGADYARSFVVFLSALVASMGACIGVLHTPPRTLRRLLWLFVYVVVIGAMLDIAVPVLHSFFEHISEPFLRTGFRYTNEMRDVTMYGLLRPKFLTSEPSNVAIFLVFAFTLLHLLEKPNASQASRLHFWGMFMLALIIVRGPTMMIVPIVAVLFARAWATAVVVAVLVPLFALLVVLLDPDLTTALAKSRIGWVLEGNDRSFFVRQILPVEVAWNTIQQYPLFGIGFGGKGPASPIALQLFWAAATRTDWIFEAAEPLGGNGFWIVWTQLGIIGAPLFIWAVVGFARAMTAWWLPALITIALFFVNGGAPNTLRVWSFTLIFLGVCHVVCPAVAFQRRTRDPRLGFHRRTLPPNDAAFARSQRPEMFGTRVPL